MGNKNTLENFLKKESLLFNKDKLEKHKKFSDAIERIFGGESCLLFKPEVIQAINFKAKYEGIESSLHGDFNNKVEIELSGKNCDLLGNICDFLKPPDEQWVLIYSEEWELCGGFIVDIEQFFLRMNEVSWVMNDDFLIINKYLDSSLRVCGDRIGDVISFYSMVSRGDEFSFIVKGLRDHM